jgi:NitT/TauT family transport system substrate-binding protein
MVRYSLLVVVALLALVVQAGNWASAEAAEKLKIASSVKVNPLYVLPILAAEEKGYWKQKGLNVEFIPFAGGAKMHRAYVAGAIDMAVSGAVSDIRSISRGVPVKLVADMNASNDIHVFVRADSGLKKATDLKGAKVGINRIGGLVHTYGVALARSLAIDKEVKFVAGGGFRQEVAGLRTGVLDAKISGVFAMAPLVHKGEVRSLVAVKPYLPKEWMDTVISAHNNSAAKRPEEIKKTIQGVLEAGQFLLTDKAWTTAKMMSYWKHSSGLAEKIYTMLSYGKDGRVSHQAVENMLTFLTEFKVLKKGQLLPANQYYTNQFVQ